MYHPPAPLLRASFRASCSICILRSSSAKGSSTTGGAGLPSCTASCWLYTARSRLYTSQTQFWQPFCTTKFIYINGRATTCQAHPKLAEEGFIWRQDDFVKIRIVSGKSETFAINKPFNHCTFQETSECTAVDNSLEGCDVSQASSNICCFSPGSNLLDQAPQVLPELDS